MSRFIVGEVYYCQWHRDSTIYINRITAINDGKVEGICLITDATPTNLISVFCHEDELTSDDIVIHLPNFNPATYTSDFPELFI